MRDWSLYVKLDTIDLDQGRRELDLKEEMDAERAAYAAQPTWKKVVQWIC